LKPAQAGLVIILLLFSQEAKLTKNVSKIEKKKSFCFLVIMFITFQLSSSKQTNKQTITCN